MNIQEFIDRYNGKKIDWDNAYGGQCVDLYRQYCHDVLEIPQSPPVQGAADIWTTYLQEHFYQVENTPEAVPIPGSVVIWNKKAGGGYGHVAVAVSGNKGSFISFDQNWNKLSVCELVTHTYTNVIGWLVPKKGTDMSQLQEQYDQCRIDRDAHWNDLVEIRRSLSVADDAAREAILSAVDDLKEKIKNSITKDHYDRKVREFEKQIEQLTTQHEQAITEKETEISSLKSQLLNKPQSIVQRFTSRKFLLTVAGFVATSVVSAAAMFGYEIDQAQLLTFLGAIVSLVVAFVGVEGYTDYKERTAQ